MEKQYTNELNSDLIREFMAPLSPSVPDFDCLPEDVKAVFREHDEYLASHPPVKMYRVAVTGSLTREGGTVQAGEHGSVTGGYPVAAVGDRVTYPDGSAASIISGAGELSRIKERGTAIVGSRLSNGDEIISTPQGARMFVFHDGEVIPGDFLADELMPVGGM